MPPLPPGFVLEAPQAPPQGSLPPLPEGFVLEGSAPPAAPDPRARHNVLTTSPNYSFIPMFGPILGAMGMNGMPKVEAAYDDPQAAYEAALQDVRQKQFPDMSDKAWAEYSKKAFSPYNLTELSQHGALYGLTDEISSGVGALGSAARNALTGKGQNFGDAFGTYEELEQSRRDLGRQQQGALGAGAEMLGGFASMGRPGMVPGGAGMALQPTLPAATGSRLGQFVKSLPPAAAAGGAYGFGSTDGGIEDRLAGARNGAGAAVVASAVAPLVARGLGGLASRAGQRTALKQVVRTAPTAAAIKSGSSAAFQAAKATGATIDQRAMGILHDEVRQILKDDGLLLGKGKVSREFPTTRHMLKALEEYAGGDVTMSQLITFKKSVARMMNSKSEAAVGLKVNELLDDFVDALPQAAWVAGDGRAATLHWAKGKADWARGRRTETIEKALYNARFKGTGNFADSLRAQLGNIITNEKRRRGFNAADIAAIEKFIEGGPVDAVLQHLSHGNPLLAAVAGHVMGGPVVGAAAAVARPAVALGAGALRNHGARQVGQQIRAGVALPGQLVPAPPFRAPQMINGVARRTGVAAENRLGEGPRRRLLMARR